MLLLFLQMPGTALPLVVLPEAGWTEFPHGLTLEGQYIVKNLVLIGASNVSTPPSVVFTSASTAATPQSWRAMRMV